LVGAIMAASNAKSLALYAEARALNGFNLDVSDKTLLLSLARAKSKPMFLHDLDSNAEGGCQHQTAACASQSLILMHNRASEP
jgi:hypothetical protein